jgi:hypothetical protein
MTRSSVVVERVLVANAWIPVQGASRDTLCLEKVHHSPLICCASVLRFRW